MTNVSPMNTAQFWRPAGLPGVEVLHEQNATRLHTLYFHAYAISAAVHVATEVRYRGQSYTITTGSVHLGEPGEVYTALRQYQPCSVYVLNLDPVVVHDTAYALGLPAEPHFRVPITWHPDIYAALRRLHASLLASSSVLEQQTRLAELLYLLLTHYGEQRPPRPLPPVGKTALYRARDYLHDHWNAPVTLDDLAHVVHHSTSYFADSFRREFGLPPHTYQLQLRVARARWLLAHGTAISEVAAEAGFADQAHLHRTFKRILGVTPANYAQNRKIVQDMGARVR